MYGITNASATGGTAKNTNLKAGTATAAEKIIFAFNEIDFISNDAFTDLTVIIYDKNGIESGRILLKANESINDADYSGTAIEFVGDEVNARYLLVGEGGISGLNLADATATPEDVAEGKVFYNSQGRQVGTRR